MYVKKEIREGEIWQAGRGWPREAFSLGSIKHATYSDLQ